MPIIFLVMFSVLCIVCVCAACVCGACVLIWLLLLFFLVPRATLQPPSPSLPLRPSRASQPLPCSTTMTISPSCRLWQRRRNLKSKWYVCMCWSVWVCMQLLQGYAVPKKVHYIFVQPHFLHCFTPVFFFFAPFVDINAVKTRADEATGFQPGLQTAR